MSNRDRYLICAGLLILTVGFAWLANYAADIDERTADFEARFLANLADLADTVVEDLGDAEVVVPDNIAEITDPE